MRCVKSQRTEGLNCAAMEASNLATLSLPSMSKFQYKRCYIETTRKFRIHSIVLARSNHWISDLKLKYHSNISGWMWTYVEHNSEVSSCKLCCSVTHYVGVFVDLGIQFAVWLSGSAIFSHYLTKRMIV